MTTPRIALSERLAPLLAERAEAKGIPVHFVRVDGNGRPTEPVNGLDAILATGISVPQLRALLGEHPTVRWVIAQSAGVDGVIVPEVLERGITVTRVRHVHDRYVAEFSMALILAAAKRLPDVIRAQARKEWMTFQPPLVEGQTLSIVGYGEIGQALASRARAFGMRIVGVRAHPRPDGLADEVWGPDRLDDALRQAQHVVLAVPGGGGRRHLIGERELRLLRPEAFLVNVGRGEVVDEEALDRVLREGGFAGALIDTFEVEPLPLDSPLWVNPRVVVSAHLAGLRASPIGDNVVDQLVDNIGRFGRGEPLANQVDIHSGY